jgi:hypothetical protein
MRAVGVAGDCESGEGKEEEGCDSIKSSSSSSKN